MNGKRIAALLVAGGALAAWLASASTAGRRPTIDTVPRAATPVEIHGAQLAAEIARLRDRLRPTTPPQAPGRNLFQFSRSNARRAATAPVAPEATEMVAPMI